MKNVLSLLIMLNFNSGFGQSSSSDFVILTFIFDTNLDNHPSSTYHWIINSDSIEYGERLTLFPIYLNLEYSSDCFDDCCDKKKIDFITTSTATKFEYSQTHERQQQELLELVKENKMLIETISMKWKGKYKRKVEVYATPVIGGFCTCNVYGTSLRFTRGTDRIYIPNSDFKLNERFWETEQGKDLELSDFSHIQFENFH